MRKWIDVKRKSSAVIPGTSFTQGEFHGLKKDTRNAVPETHSIDEKLPIAAQIVLDWLRVNYSPDVRMVITSTRRTPQFNMLISSTGESGVHTRGIAFDFILTSNGVFDKGAWCCLKNELLRAPQAPEMQHLLNYLFSPEYGAEIGGIGIYGDCGEKASYFFHIDTRGEGDGLSRSKTWQAWVTHKYSLWTRGNIECQVDPTQQNTQTEEQFLQSQITESTPVFEFFKYQYTGQSPIVFDDIVQLPFFEKQDLRGNDIRDIVVDSFSNNRRAWESLTTAERRERNNDDESYSDSVDYPLGLGGMIYIPYSMISKHNQYQSNFTTTLTSYNDIFPPILRKLTLDPGYVPAHLNRGLDGKQIRPHLRVFVWSRYLYMLGRDMGYVDVTDDIHSVDISNELNSGGDFTINISAVSALFDKETPIASVAKHGEVGINKSNINFERTFRTSGESASEIIRSVPYYRRMFQKNDLVFISFEKLEIDGRIDENVNGKWYDMIGMIDHIQEASSPVSDISVIIRGRSLIGALMDDNSYFNPISIGHSSSSYGDDPFANGRYFGGAFHELSAILARTIQQSADFIFHRISTIGYVPDDIFSMFDDKTVISKWIRRENLEEVTEERDVRGIWQIIKFHIDQNIQHLNLADTSISNPQGSVLELLTKICQSPFVEFFTDTYGDKFYLIARKPPFDAEAARLAVYETPTDVTGEFLQYQSSQAESVGGPRDSDENVYEREIKMWSRKVNEDQRTFFNKVNELEEIKLVSTVYPKIINISEDDVLQQSLRMSSKGYAWYQLEEQGNFLGARMGVGMIPAVYFDTFAQVFGNRRLTVVSNYTSLNFYLDKEVDHNRNIYADQIAQQLSFLVETNIHLPFTREGQITLNGDRRIKVGNYIYFRPTKEVFYVTGVANHISVLGGGNIERDTTITVERGMKIQYINTSLATVIDKETGEEKDIDVSYFNIVDIYKLRQGIYDITAKEKLHQGKFDIDSEMVFNHDVFEFFLQNRQFDE